MVMRRTCNKLERKQFGELSRRKYRQYINVVLEHVTAVRKLQEGLL